MTPGIIWVNSGAIKLDRLSDDQFDDWYSNEHIPDVVALSGVSGAARYCQVNNSAENLLMGTKSSSEREKRLKVPALSLRHQIWGLPSLPVSYNI